MARIDISSAGQTLEAGVVDFNAVYLDVTEWKLAVSPHIPTGIYEGNGIVVTDSDATTAGAFLFDSIFSPTTSGEYDDTIVIDSTGSGADPDSIQVLATGMVPYDGGIVLSWEPNPIDFGGVVINERKDIPLVVTNEQGMFVDLVMTTPENVFIVDPTDSTILISSLAITLSPSGDYTFIIVFLPTEVRDYAIDIYSTVNDGSSIDYIEAFSFIGRGTYAESFSDLLSGNVNQEYEEFEDEDNSQNQYIDFDGQMIKNDLNGDIFFKNDQDAVMQSIRHLLLSPKIYDSNSINLKDLIFENIDSPFHLSRIAETIEDFIIDSEPRIGNINVGAQIDFNDNEKVNLEVSFTLLSNTGVFYNYPLFIRLR